MRVDEVYLVYEVDISIKGSMDWVFIGSNYKPDKPDKPNKPNLINPIPPSNTHFSTHVYGADISASTLGFSRYFIHAFFFHTQVSACAAVFPLKTFKIAFCLKHSFASFAKLKEARNDNLYRTWSRGWVGRNYNRPLCTQIY
jgi:hypothetical protein